TGKLFCHFSSIPAGPPISLPKSYAPGLTAFQSGQRLLHFLPPRWRSNTLLGEGTAMIVPSFVEDLTRAFQTARVEMMAVRTKDARVIAVTEEVLKRWNCRREDVFNKSLAKFGTGTLSARYITEADSAQRIEVTYSQPL